VWRLAAWGKSGKPLAEKRWGITTFLSFDDAAVLATDEKELQDAIKAAPEDTSLLVLLAELYRSYGVVGKSLETLESTTLVAQPGIAEAIKEIYETAGVPETTPAPAQN
ncbi:MAG TPA: hypothetical protein VF719_10295, partial [Abditibacteriaceae bacterium]|jgi:hypothetical protein